MHELAPLIKDLAVILGLASVVTLLCQKIRQPVVLGYLLAGAIIGPYTPPYRLIDDVADIKILSELGVIFLMFSLGLEFSFHKLKRVGFSAGVTGIVVVISMLLLGFGTGQALGWSFYDSLFLGAGLSISSTTIIIKALEELNLKSKRFAEIIFGILVVEDLLAILLLVGLTTIVHTSGIMSWSMLIAMLKLILVVGGWFLLGYFLMPTLFRRIMHYVSEETLTVVSVALCLIMVCVAAYFEYSTALGAFIMGSILAETTLVHRIEHLIQPIRNIFAAVFFVSIGMLINPQLICAELPLVLLICGVTILGSITTAGIGAFLTGQSLNNALRIGFSMGQIGEFSFIIAGLGTTLNVTSSKLYPIIVAVSAVTTFTTPYLIKLSGTLSNKIDQKISARTRYILDSYTTWVYRLMANDNSTAQNPGRLTRFIINGVVVAILFTITKHWVLPRFINIANPDLAKILSWFTALLLSSPFIWGMLVAFRNQASTYKKTGYRTFLPMQYLIWLLAIFEIAFLSITFFETWVVLVLLFLVAILYFRLVYKQLDKSYHWFEKHLMRNLQAKVNYQAYYDQLAPWDTHFIEVEVPRHSPIVGKELNEIQLRQKFGINIVAIYRGTAAILSPRGHQVILPFDKLVLLGSDEQIELFTQQFIHTAFEIENTNLLENFAQKTVVLKEDSPHVGKSIRDSNIREQTHGLVVGLERKGIRTLNPDSTTILEAGDLLFLVGENEYLKKLE
jgi:CPA2 family monovalent cation:H+ antiporter-2